MYIATLVQHILKRKMMKQSNTSFLTLKSDDEFVSPAVVHIIGNRVFIETEDESIMLSVDQAKTLSYFINDKLIRNCDED